MKKLLFIFFCFFIYAENNNLENLFSRIYELGTWDEQGFSLSGSQIEITKEYVEFLQDFLQKNQINSVVDIGCGDWAFSRYINWSGINYLGIDIVEFVVKRNQTLFSQPSIKFIHANALTMELPEADLLLCKDVFQHLSNEDIGKLLRKFCKYKHCLITNYVDPLSSFNQDIISGQYHPIDLTKPPFNIKGKKILTFQAINAPKQVLYIKKEDFKK